MTQLRIVVVSLLLLAAVAVLYLGGLKSVKLEPIYNNIAELNRVVKNLTQIEEISNAWMRDYYTKQALERVTQLHNIGDSSGFQILYNVIVPEREQQKGTKESYKRINGKLGVIHISNEEGHRIEDIFDSNNDTFADILKIDVEGAEMTTLVPFLSNRKYRVCQRTSLYCFMLNYALFSYEVNGNAMEACEYCFIHASCMKQYGVVELKRYLNDV
ncbi:hypothetical protein ANCCEY_03328 [Ancylostoma ceylanicum]|uniref:Methyltransferase FkbM domain-containing protein n=1 Tax=Ancylostoma ceylanicum TaxID=53326 RepID=A0A0D6LZV7_9BILA|nr:hypothetical protein ANCCEY_03328 [Ancylostoma ceylanicum]